jgi:hypothetical protein
MTRYRYPIAILYPDYLRAALGLALTAGPLALLDLAPAIAWLLSGLALLFVWFGLRTALRQLSQVELSAQAIAIRGPLGRHLSWDELARVKLAYYAPRGARGRRRNEQRGDGDQPGWLQLTLRGAHGRPIRVDSTLEGFDQVLRRAMANAERKDLALDPTTLANLAALGLERGGTARAELKPAASDLAASPGSRGSL